MTTEHLLSAYIDTNIVLITVAIIWFGFKQMFAHSSLRQAYQTQLNLLYGLVAMLALSPFVAVGTEAFQRWGVLSNQTGVSLSDFLVSQYLDGNLALAPPEFERLLMLPT